MMKPVGLFSVVLLMTTLAVVVRGQTNANFSGTWTLSKIEPPPTGRGIGGGGDEAFGAIAQMVVIAQTGSDLTFQSGSVKAVYTLDNNTTVNPPGDDDGLKTQSHWEGLKHHLSYR